MLRPKEYSKYRKIFKHYIANGHIKFPSTEVNLKTKDLYYLAAKGIISIEPYSNQDPNCAITISAKGFTYTDDVLVSLIQFLVPTLISIAALVLSFF